MRDTTTTGDERAKVMEGLFCVPGRNAFVERVDRWEDFGRLNLDT